MIGLGPMILAGYDPCAASPTITSAGASSVGATGDCSTVDLRMDTTVTLSASLPADYTLEKRTYFGTSSTPSYGGWSDSGLSGTGGTYQDNVGLWTTTDNGNSSATYYYNIQWRIVGRDGSTVCDGPDSATQWSGTVYDCFA